MVGWFGERLNGERWEVDSILRLLVFHGGWWIAAGVWRRVDACHGIQRTVKPRFSSTMAHCDVVSYAIFGTLRHPL
jgi:hypothetical protein